MLIALFTIMFLAQGPGTSVLMEDLVQLEQAIEVEVKDEETRLQALAMVEDIRQRVERYNEQRRETIEAVLASDSKPYEPSVELQQQIDAFDRETKLQQQEIIGIFLELRSILGPEQWEAINRNRP